MNMNELAKLVCQSEGLSKQVDIAQVKEILAVLSDICAVDNSVLETIYENALKRAEKPRKKKSGSKKKLRK